MGDFKKRGFGGGRDFKKRDFGGRPSFGGGRSDRGSRPMQMFTAVCADCHKECEVPFRPDGRKPVYCSDCFGSHRDSGPANFGKKDFSPRPFPRNEAGAQSGPNLGELKSQIDRLSSKLDKVIEMLQGGSVTESGKKFEEVKEVLEKKVATAKKEPKKKAVTPKKKAVKKTK